jgi:hypothetical protein
VHDIWRVVDQARGALVYQGRRFDQAKREARKYVQAFGRPVRIEHVGKSGTSIMQEIRPEDVQ